MYLLTAKTGFVCLCDDQERGYESNTKMTEKNVYRLEQFDLARKEGGRVLKKLEQEVSRRQYPTWTVILDCHSQSISV